MTIRRDTPADCAAVRQVIEDAFGRPDEADLVERLRAEGAVLGAFVAEADGRVVGHVLFSRMWIDSEEAAVSAVALAPMAVSSGYQRQGIGSRLIRRGLDWLASEGERIAIVLGHPEYYPRFGFSSEKARPLESPFRRDAFMAMELVPGALAGVRGRVRYAKAFGL